VTAGVRGPTLRDARVAGRFAMADLAGVLGRAFAAADGDRTRTFAVADVSATVDLDRAGLRYRELRAVVRGAWVGGWGWLPFGPSLEPSAAPLLALHVDHVPAPLIAEVAGLRGANVPIAGPGVAGLPPDLELTGDLLVAADHAASGSLSLETPRSALKLKVAVGASGRELLGSTLRGRMAAADAIALGLFPDAVHPRCADVAHVDARLTGTLSRPGITGRLSVTHLSLETEGPVLAIEDASALLDFGPEGLAWHRLAGRFYGGSVSSSGKLARKTGALVATLTWRDVRVDAVPTRASGESGLAGQVAGACSGELHFERHSLAPHALTAYGHVSLDEPVFAFVRSFTSRLSRFGLPAIEPRGAKRATAKLRFERGEMVVEPIALAFDGIDVDGVLRLREAIPASGASGKNRILGRLVVHLRDAYLGRSPLLAIPAAFSGEVVIPIYVRGTPGALDVKTDAMEILDGLLARSPVGEAVKGAWGSLRRAGRAPRLHPGPRSP
jgi:hypothetical protein